MLINVSCSLTVISL